MADTRVVTIGRDDDRHHHAPGDGLVDARRAVRHDLPGDQQDPHDLRSGGDDHLPLRPALETRRSAAALATFGVGCTLGIVYFILDLPSVGSDPLRPGSPCRKRFHGLVTDPNYGLGIPFMLFGAMLWGVCIAVYVGTSLLTPAPATAQG